MQGSQAYPHIYPHTPQTLRLTYVCMRFKSIHPYKHIMHFLTYIDAYALNTSSQIHTHAHLTNIQVCVYTPKETEPCVCSCTNTHTHKHTLRQMHECVITCSCMYAHTHLTNRCKCMHAHLSRDTNIYMQIHTS